MQTFLFIEELAQDLTYSQIHQLDLSPGTALSLQNYLFCGIQFTGFHISPRG